MEAIAAFGLVGLGYLVTKLSDTKEGFEPVHPLQKSEKGNSVKAPYQDLDLQYTSANGEIYRSEPNPGQKGNAFSYSGSSGSKAMPRVTPQPIEAATSQVALNPGNFDYLAVKTKLHFVKQ